jgi:hypothetical protein
MKGNEKPAKGAAHDATCSKKLLKGIRTRIICHRGSRISLKPVLRSAMFVRQVSMYAQAQVHGRPIDMSGQPVPFVNVVLLQAGDCILEGKDRMQNCYVLYAVLVNTGKN